MNPKASEVSYQRAAVQSATPIGLTIILYDKLVSDLTQAIEAIRKRNIEARCQTLNHALQVVQHLQSSLDMDHGGATAQSLADFYSYLRSAFLQAHGEDGVDILTRQIELILQVRQAWNQVDCPAKELSAEVPAPLLQNFYGSVGEEFARASWSA